MNVFEAVEECKGAAVVGGYPRDLALGGICKDVDVAVYGAQRTEVAAALVAKLIKLGYTLTSTHEDADYNGSEAGLYDVIYQLEPPSELLYPVDILVFAQASTLQECLDTFDYNMNKWFMGVDQPLWRGESYGTLVASNKPRTSERAAKMEAKARAYGWRV